MPDGIIVKNSGDGTVVANGESVTDVPVTTHTHVWGQPAWTWNADNTAKATFTCEKDSAHQETVTASVTSQVEKEPGCEEPGETVYTATVEWGGQTYTDSKRVETAATGHTPGEAVKENEVAATCEKEGSYDSVV